MREKLSTPESTKVGDVLASFYEDK
jgi:hypothetical protein